MKTPFILLAAVIIISVHAFGDNPSASKGNANQPAPAKDTLVSLNMPDVFVVDALRMLAKLEGLNIIIDEQVQGNINLFFQDVPFQDAWSAVMMSAGLSETQQGGIIAIFPTPQLLDASPLLETRVIKLKYISLGSDSLSNGGGSSGQTSSSSQSSSGDVGGGLERDDPENKTPIDEILKSSFGENLLKVSKDERTNQLVLTGSTETLEAAIKLIDALDHPAEQILIEAKVIQARKSALDDIGVNWGGIYTISNSGESTVSSNRTRNEPIGAIVETMQQNGSFSSSLSGFNVTISALIERGDAHLLFSPRVVTQNNKEAFISSGQEIQIPSGLDINGNSTYRERQVTLELGVTPRVLADSLLRLTIRLRNDSINYAQQQISGVPPLDVNSVESIVTLHDEDTVVIGGIITRQDSYNTFNVPLLSKIPLLGMAFRQKEKQLDNSELLIMIKPTVVTKDNKNTIEYSLKDFSDVDDVSNILLKHPAAPDKKENQELSGSPKTDKSAKKRKHFIGSKRVGSRR
jgi:type IV pilus assembly protein PilQ